MRQSSETKTKENLPFDLVVYPRGAFPVFKASKSGLGYSMCDCMTPAVENYLELRRQTHPEERRLDVWNFPESFVRQLEEDVDWEKDDFSMADWTSHISFQEGLCHRCNKAKPSETFCPASEGTVFRSGYGWYLDMKHYEFGVVPRLQRYLKDMRSKQLHEIIDFTYESLLEDILFDPAIDGLPEESVREWLRAHDEIWREGTPRIWDPQFPYNFVQALNKELHKRKTAVRRYIEDAVRADFEYMPLVGKWKSEQLLYDIVRKLVPKVKIKRNYRSRTLDHLELDIWIPSLNLGIEYQGIQHYEPVKHWGGMKGLEKVQQRDLKKKELAEEKGINIVYFHHYEVLSPELVYKRLKPYGPLVKPYFK